MFVPQAPPREHHTPFLNVSGAEALQSICSNCSGTLVAAISQLHLHFWTNTEHPVFLLSVEIPQCSLEEDPATLVVWHTHAANRLVVLTARRAVFFEADIHVSGRELLGHGEVPSAGARSSATLPYCAAASRVCAGDAVRFDAGLVTSAETAGAAFFMVCTTSGNVYLVSWRSQCVVRTWTSLDVQRATTSITVVPRGRADSESFPSCESPESIQFVETVPTLPTMLTDPILHCNFAPRLGLLTMILSSGYLLLLRVPETESLLTLPLRFSASSALALPSACLASTNSTHLMMAVATQTWGVSAYAIDMKDLRLSTKSLWKSNRFLNDAKKRNGPISCMQWCSGTEDMLCVGFYRTGAVVLHYSGTCLLTTSASGEDFIWRSPLQSNTAQLSAGYDTAVLHGCISASWSHSGNRLLTVEPQSTAFQAFTLGRVLGSREVTGQQGCSHPFVAVMTDYKVATVDANGCHSDVAVPANYLLRASPLRYGSLSTTSEWLVCAGQHAWATLHLPTRCWYQFAGDKGTSVMRCVADPVWIDNVALVVPVVHTNRGAYEIVVVEPTKLALKQAQATLMLASRPLMLSATHRYPSGDGFIAVLDVEQVVHVHRYNTVVERTTGQLAAVAFTLVREVTFGDTLCRPLWMQLVEERFHPGDCASSLPVLLVHRSIDHTLVCLHLGRNESQNATSKQPFHLQEGEIALAPLVSCGEGLEPSRVFHAWVEGCSPLEGVRVVTLQESGLVLHQLLWSPCSSLPQQSALNLHTWDEYLVPLGIAPNDGYVMSLLEASNASTLDDGTSPILRVRPVFFAPHILSLLLQQSMLPKLLPQHPQPVKGHVVPTTTVASGGPPDFVPFSGGRSLPLQPAVFLWDTAFFLWLQRLRECDSFVPTMDYFLYRLINESAPAGIAGHDWRGALRATIALLRSFPEFYEIILGCVRKIDVSRWGVVLDILGSPEDFFKECLENHRFAEALHLVRVIMMGDYRAETANKVATDDATDGAAAASASKAAMHKAAACATELFEWAVRNSDFASAYDLLRFTALLQHEIGMPAASDTAKEDGVLAWLMQMAMWPNAATSVAPLHTVSPKLWLIAPGGEPTPPCAGSPEHSLVSEGQQRLEAIEVMFSLYSSMPTTVEAKASELLRSGHLLQLCYLSETFLFALPHFLEAMRTHMAELLSTGGASSITAHYTVAFAGLHTELGLPQCQRPIGKAIHSFDMLRFEGAGAEVDIKERWTQAQVVLYSCKQRRSSLDALCYAFGAYPPYNILLPLLRMDKTQLLTRVTASVSSQPPLLCLSHLAGMVDAPMNRGYRPFLGDVVNALPLALLNTPQNAAEGAFQHRTESHVIIPAYLPTDAEY